MSHPKEHVYTTSAVLILIVAACLPFVLFSGEPDLIDAIKEYFLEAGGNREYMNVKN